jgi:hypothetical protein
MSEVERANCELCGEPMPKGEEMFKYHGFSGPCPKPALPSVPIEEAICRVMSDFRYRRMKYKVEHPETIETDDVPDNLTRHAEASAIAALFPRHTPKPAPPTGQGDPPYRPINQG